MLQDCESQLQQKQMRRDAAKDRLDNLTHTLNTVKAVVQQLRDKLQHIPLVLMNLLSQTWLKPSPRLKCMFDLF